MQVKILEKIFKKIEKEVLESIDGMKTFVPETIKLTEWELFQMLRYIGMFQEAGGKFLLESIKTAGKDIMQRYTPDKTFDINDPRVAPFVNERSIEYAEMITGTTADQVDNIVRNGLKDGLTINEISGEIAGYFANQAPMRAERIARTEAVRATNKSRTIGMLQGGFEYHMWVTQRDAKVRDSHASLDGVIVKIGENFPVPVDYMGDADYPSDINERSGTIPVKKPKKKHENSFMR